MATKKKSGLVPQTKESARNIWLAGVGALATAEDEGGKYFDTLVKKGASYEKKNKTRLEKALANVKDVREDVSEVFGKAFQPLNKAMEATLHRLGVPTRKEITTLSKRVEELTKAVEKKGNGRKKATKKTARKTAKKAAPKTTA